MSTCAALRLIYLEWRCPLSLGNLNNKLPTTGTWKWLTTDRRIPRNSFCATSNCSSSILAKLLIVRPHTKMKTDRIIEAESIDVSDFDEEESQFDCSIALLRYANDARSLVCVCVCARVSSLARTRFTWVSETLSYSEKRTKERESESLLDIEVIRPLRSVLVWGAIKLCAGVTHDGFWLTVTVESRKQRSSSNGRKTTVHPNAMITLQRRMAVHQRWHSVLN